MRYFKLVFQNIIKNIANFQCTYLIKNNIFLLQTWEEHANNIFMLNWTINTL